MKIFNVLKKGRYLAIAVISTILLTGTYIYSQVLGIWQNIDLWFTVIPWYNALLFVIFTAMFGVTLSYQIYVWKQPKVCGIRQKIKGAGTSGVGTGALFLVAQCPACASLGALFLPFSVIGVFVKFSWLINLITIGLLLFTLRYLGAFKRE